MKFHLTVSLLAGLLFLNACKSDKKAGPVAETKVEIKYPSFNKDSAYQFVRQQVLFGPRVPNTEAHRNCAAWFVETFKRFGAKVIEQKFQKTAFDGTLLNGINIIAQINPSAKRRILLASHWDTRPWADSDPDPVKRKKPFDSADDGPSSAGVLLELARALQSQPLSDLGVDIVLFDLEDYGTENNSNSWGLGSQYWSANLHAPGYRPMYGVLLDIVGGANPGFYKEEYSVYYAEDIVNKVWNLAETEGYGGFFPKSIGGGVLDDHYFVNTIAKIPMIDIINRPDGKRFPHYHHTHKDNMDVIDPNTLHMVGRLMIKLIYKEDAGVI
ncbi:MAG TPA: M28 family peptidase [Saprospiraceae bacterium]|nr:M28 family peptidase [Saprospiraceae bacterium]